MREIGTCSIAALLFASVAIADEIPGSDIDYGNWSGAAYVAEDTGRFSHCVISADYVSGLTLLFSVNRDATVGVGVAGPLGINGVDSFPVALFVDRRAPFYAEATAVSPDFAVLQLEDFVPAMEALQRGFELRIDALGQSSYFSLKGTFRALEAARSCALKYFDYESQPSASLEPSIDKTALFQMTTMAISELGIRDFRYLDEAELRELGWEDAVAWEATESGLSGFSVMTPFDASAGSLRDSDPSDTAFIARGCQGDYATSARSLKLGDETEARELRLMCSGEVESEMFLSKFLFESSVVYNLIVFERDVSEEIEERQEMSEAVALRAASFMAQR